MLPIPPRPTEPSAVDASHALSFILAGSATFTLESAKSGERFTYQLIRAKEGSWLVALLTGPSNVTDWTTVGSLQRTDGEVRFHPEAHWSPFSPSYKALWWTICRLQAGLPTTQLVVHHAGTCGACGRLLTTPESLAKGLGPVCAEKAGA